MTQSGLLKKPLPIFLLMLAAPVEVQFTLIIRNLFAKTDGVSAESLFITIHTPGCHEVLGETVDLPWKLRHLSDQSWL